MATGTLDAEFTLEMRNNAPSSRQPCYVIGNALGAPLGTNRTYVSVFTRLPTEGLRVDGVAVDSEFGVEAGYFVTSAFVTVPSGEQRTVTTSVSGSVDTSDGYSLFVRSPPAVGDTPFDVEVDVVDDARSETTQLDRAGRPARRRSALSVVACARGARRLTTRRREVTHRGRSTET